ncbi:MAG: cytochrome c3 family protein, partial [Planctomycetota bacterium]
MAHRRVLISCCLLLAACPGPPAPAELQKKSVAVAGTAPRFRTEIVLPHDQLGMNTGRKEFSGKPARVKCITCHADFEPRKGYERAKNIPGLHEAITIDHGELTCQSCHNPPRFQDFRMVDGGTVDYADVMDLCGQCHGAIRKDYNNGAHGGMRGHWDLTAGPRDRNHCLHCHNA